MTPGIAVTAIGKSQPRLKVFSLTQSCVRDPCLVRRSVSSSSYNGIILAENEPLENPDRESLTREK